MTAVTKPIAGLTAMAVMGIWLLAGLAPLAVAADTEANKDVVVAFYQMTFREHNPREAADKWIGDRYIQHNPHLPDGKEAFVDYFTRYFVKNPYARSEIKRVIAEDDLVVLHVHAKATPDERGRAVVDIFRLEDGKIVEHWDVSQPIPESSTNDNTMF